MPEYVNHRDVTTAEDLTDALAVLIEDADTHPDTIQLIPGEGHGIRLTLEEATLSDGSKVKNIRVNFI